MPHYDVLISEPLGRVAEPIEPGEPTPEVQDAWWSGEANSPEDAIRAGLAAWREKYGEDAPEDTVKKVTPGPDVCERCEGRGKLKRYVPSGLVDRGSALGPADEKICPDCLGSGKVR